MRHEWQPRCPSRPRLPRLGLDRGNRDGVYNIFSLATSRKIVGRTVEALENRPDRRGPGQSLGQFVSYIPRLKIRENQHIRAACDA